ncbi:hypothetical protein S40293_04143 [Stachybotrys chartarum IBT 40293]|nr:hypothetical protein S40293_04143 [Stachybotrys chartarum IBT 40293]
MQQSLILLTALVVCTRAESLPGLPAFLQETSIDIFPALKDVSSEIYHNPELGRDERHAHDLIVEHFRSLEGWTVTPHAYGRETALETTFEYRPGNFHGPLPTVGFLAEYDALEGVGHACGHNHIALNGMLAARLASQALIRFDIPGRIKLVGCPDEENAAGKFQLNQHGAFNSSDVWLMAHPTSTSAIQPMNGRLNLFPTFVGETHEDAVRKAYEAMVIVADLPDGLPGTASSASTIVNVGMYAVNVVQTQISLGVLGSTLEIVTETLNAILDETYPGVAFAVFEDTETGGVGMNMTGPGGHASENTRGPLTLSVEVFRVLSGESSLSFYLPGNTTVRELDITVDLRSRYTLDLPALADFVGDSIGHLADSVSSDVKYPSLELLPYFPETFVSLIQSPPYGMTDWIITDFAPASTDASWVENPELDEDSRDVISVAKAVFHANYGICEPNGDVPCAFNHEPAFAVVAGTDYSYSQTEIVARAEAHMAVDLLADPARMREATALVRG